MNDILIRWQELHKRSVCGEKLSDTDRTFYEAELARMHAEENYEGNILQLKRLRESAFTAEKENIEVKARLERNRKEIAALESKLSERDKVLLGIGG